MSFFYNARLNNPIPYQTVGAWRGGYSMGHWGGGYSLSGVDAAGYSTPYEADDFDAEDLEKARKVLNALKSLQATPAALRQQNLDKTSDDAGRGSALSRTIAGNIIASAVEKIAPIFENATDNVFDVVGTTRDPDPSLYVIYGAIHDLQLPEDAGGKSAIAAWRSIGEQLPNAHGFSSIDELSDALGELYETYYAAYWDEEAAKQQAATGKPAAPKPAPKTGKPRKTPTKAPMQTPRKGSNLLTYLLIGGGVLGAVWLGMKFLKK